MLHDPDLSGMMHRGLHRETQGLYGVCMHCVASKHIELTAGSGSWPVLLSLLTAYQCGR